MATRLRAASWKQLMMRLGTIEWRASGCRVSGSRNSVQTSTAPPKAANRPKM